MLVREIWERMERRAPACVMLRGLLENVFAAERLDRLFERTARSQENKTLLFSTVAEIMGLVALKVRPSVHAAYQAQKAEIGITAKALYDKLQRTEPCVSQMVVRDSGARLRRFSASFPEAAAKCCQAIASKSWTATTCGAPSDV